MISAGPLQKPPGPIGLPLLGTLPEFRKQPAEFLLRVSRDFGDIAFFRLGPQQMYFLNRPDLIQEVLVTAQGNFIKSRMLQRAKILLGEGLLTSEGQQHLRQRRLVQPAFHRERLASYAKDMVACARVAQDKWMPGMTLDIAEEMMQLTLAIISRTMFSFEVEKQARDVGEALTAIFRTFDTITL
ncbi:MAG TPA: cytochrome P450, partial [Bryobacteraceae bacterium]|nr:cytochrome P450 [Bryobacteraceae bacterium]